MTKLNLTALVLASSSVLAIACASPVESGNTGVTGVGTGGAFGATGGTTGVATGGSTGVATGGSTGFATGGTTSTATGGSSSTGGGVSGATYIGGADAGLTTGGVSVAADKGGSTVTMTKGTNPGEICFKGSTPAVSDWATQWGFSASFELAGPDMTYDGSSANNINYSVTGTAPTLQIGLSDNVSKAPNGTDLLTFWASATISAGASTAISSLQQPAWTVDSIGSKSLDKSKLNFISITIAADVAAKSFDFCITNPTIDGFTGVAM